MENIVFAVGLIAGAIDARTTLIGARGGVVDRRFPRLLLGLGATVSMFSLVAWAFIEYDWYVPILSFVGAAIFAGAVVTRDHWSLFYRVSPAIGVIAIGAAAWCWFNS